MHLFHIPWDSTTVVLRNLFFSCLNACLLFIHIDSLVICACIGKKTWQEKLLVRSHCQKKILPTLFSSPFLSHHDWKAILLPIRSPVTATISMGIYILLHLHLSLMSSKALACFYFSEAITVRFMNLLVIWFSQPNFSSIYSHVLAKNYS